MAVDFGNVKSDVGLQKLDAHMATHSYVAGYNPTQQDVAVFSKLLGAPASKFPHAGRWYRQIASYTEEGRAAWPGQKPKAQQKEAAAEEEADFDPFADETPEEAQAAQAVAAKKPEKKKKVVINKSQLVIDVKPTSVNTNLDELEKLVKGIKMDGVEWSVTCKKVPIAFGLMKLQIGCNIVDDLVNTDDILAQIECLGLSEEKAAEKMKRREAGEDDDEDEDEESTGLVQSAEIVSFNKL